MSSDSTTTQENFSTPDDDATGPTPGVLGVGMAYRSRSQSVLGRHWSPSGVVGAVGRASVGFGLAVGRSSAIRPTVRFDDLNSAALRPSFDSWRLHRGLHGSADRASDAARDVLVRRTVPANGNRSLSTRGAVPAVAARRVPIEPQRRHRDQLARPTWTDQIIQRSAPGFVAVTSTDAAPTPVVPADFVPTGDPKLDQLRLLVRQRERDAAGRGAASESHRPAGDRVPDPSRLDRQVRRTTAAEPMLTGGVDGPGRLVRAMRPEPTVTRSVPPARLGGPPAPRGSAVGTSGGASGAPPVRRSVTGSRPGARRARPAGASRLEQLRAALVEQGILGAAPEDPVEQLPSAVDSAPASVERPVGRRSPDTAARTGRVSSSEVDATTSSIAAAPAPSPAPPRTPPGSPLPDASQAERASASTPRSTPMSSPQAGTNPSVGAVALAERPTVSTAPSVETAPVTSQPDRQLRAQRLLRSGLVAESPAPPDASDGRRDRRPGSVTSAEAVPTASSVDPVLTSALPVLRMPNPPGPVAEAPVLARADSSPSTVVRRVTLPRALSRAHRPAPQHPIAAMRDDTGTARTDRASTIGLARVRTLQSAIVPTTADSPRPAALNSRSIVAATASPLLDVVRRSSSNVPTPDDVTPTVPLRPAAGDRSAATDRPADTEPSERPSAAAIDDGSAEHRTQRPAQRVAEQFMAVLSQTVQRTPAPLPTAYRPLADAIAGPLSGDALHRWGFARRVALGGQGRCDHRPHDPPRSPGGDCRTTRRGDGPRADPRRTPVAGATVLRRSRRQPRGAPSRAGRTADGPLAARTVGDHERTDDSTSLRRPNDSPVARPDAAGTFVVIECANRVGRCAGCEHHPRRRPG